MGTHQLPQLPVLRKPVEMHHAKLKLVELISATCRLNVLINKSIHRLTHQIRGLPAMLCLTRKSWTLLSAAMGTMPPPKTDAR